MNFGGNDYNILNQFSTVIMADNYHKLDIKRTSNLHNRILFISPVNSGTVVIQMRPEITMKVTYNNDEIDGLISSEGMYDSDTHYEHFIPVENGKVDGITIEIDTFVKSFLNYEKAKKENTLARTLFS